MEFLNWGNRNNLFILNQEALITVQCPNSGEIIISGSGTAAIQETSSPATFTLTAINNEHDTFQMVIDAENDDFDYNRGVVTVILGDIIVENCPTIT